MLRSYVVCHHPSKDIFENLMPYIYVMVRNVLDCILRNAPNDGQKSGRNTWESYYVYNNII